MEAARQSGAYSIEPRSDDQLTKIEVRGDKARLYVHDASQPVLVVNDLKHGQSQGQIALSIGPGTVAHFADLRVSK